MGRRGPKPQPTALKIERGNPGHRPLNTDEPVLDAPLATVPPGLHGEAREEWERLAGHLIDRGVLTVGDLNAFKQYCQLAGHVAAMEKKMAKAIKEDDLGCIRAYNQLSTRLNQQAAHLGLTPSSRSAVKASKVTPKDATADKRTRFFGTKPA